MPFSRTLRIRASRHRTAPTSTSCSYGGLHRPAVTPAVLREGVGRGEAARARGTTLGYVKYTWSQLVSRCEHSPQEEDEPQISGQGAAACALSGGLDKSSGGTTMPKRRPVAKTSPTAIINNNNNNNNDPIKHNPAHNTSKRKLSSSSSQHPHWVPSSTLIKTTVLIVLVTVGPALILSYNKLGHVQDLVSETSPGVKNNGGWRLADEDTVRRLDSSTCNIDRVSVTQMSPARFEQVYRYKRPVIVTFPNGARDWTDPTKWTLEALKRSYGEWKISSGDSLEIVRRGGNGDVTSSFDDFIGHMMEDRSKRAKTQPMYYMFDRAFYKDSELPGTLQLPAYFSNDDSLNDSIFFLGTSGTGVVFHKHADTWNAVVYGKKRWFLYPMTHTPPGGVYHGFPIRDWYERVYPNLTLSQRPLECVQQGGEILYLPEGFYHATLNIGDTIAVAQQFKHPTLVAEKLMYQVTALNKELGDQNKDHQEVHQNLLNTFLKLRELLPDSSEITMKLGEKYGDLGHHNRAVDLLQKAVHMDPYFVLAYTALGNNLASLGRLEEAEAALTHAVSLSPEAWDVYRDYGTFLMKRARYAEAVPVLRKGTELNPSLIPFWSYLRKAQEETGDREGARRTQEKIDELNQRLKNSSGG